MGVIEAYGPGEPCFYKQSAEEIHGARNNRPIGVDALLQGGLMRLALVGGNERYGGISAPG